MYDPGCIVRIKNLLKAKSFNGREALVVEDNNDGYVKVSIFLSEGKIKQAKLPIKNIELVKGFLKCANDKCSEHEKNDEIAPENGLDLEK